MDEIGGKKIPIATKEQAPFKSIELIVRKNEIRLGDIAEVTAGVDNISLKTKISDIISGTKPIMMVKDLARNHIDYSLDHSTYQINSRAIEKTLLFISKRYNPYSRNRTSILEKSPCIFLNYDVENIIYDLGYLGISICC